MALKLDAFKCAATRYKGRVYEGSIHPLIYEDIKHTNPNVRPHECEEGFLTSSGLFLNRVDAKALAEKLDLLCPARPGDVTPELYSEQMPGWVLQRRAAG